MYECNHLHWVTCTSFEHCVDTRWKPSMKKRSPCMCVTIERANVRWICWNVCVLVGWFCMQYMLYMPDISMKSLQYIDSHFCSMSSNVQGIFLSIFCIQLTGICSVHSVYCHITLIQLIQHIFCTLCTFNPINFNSQLDLSNKMGQSSILTWTLVCVHTFCPKTRPASFKFMHAYVSVYRGFNDGIYPIYYGI